MSLTVSRSGHFVALMRLRNSVSSASGTFTWNGRIVAPADFSVMSDMWVSFGFVTALSLIVSSARRAPTLSVSTRHRPSDVWALAGALRSSMGFIVYGSPILLTEKGIGRIDHDPCLAT